MKCINKSIVAIDNSIINGAKVKESSVKSNLDTAINESIVAARGSVITNATINIRNEKKRSFWKGFMGGIVTSVIASAIWYLIQNCIEKN